MNREELVKNYKDAFKKFQDGLQYIQANQESLKKDPARLDKIQRNFRNKYETPLETAWEALEQEDKDRFATLYFLRKEGADEEIDRIKKVADLFGGKIISVNFIKQGENDDKGKKNK